MVYALLGIAFLVLWWVLNTMNENNIVNSRDIQRIAAFCDTLKEEVEILKKGKETLFDKLEINIGDRESIEFAGWLHKEYAARQELERTQSISNWEKQKEADIASVKKWMADQDDDDAEAQYNLGVAYYFGWGVERDESTAFDWMLKAAESWNPARRNIGTAYFRGFFVEQDEKKAFEYWSDAGADYDGETQFLLGMAYANGIGVEKNMGEALSYLKMAAQQGQALASCHLGNWYYNASCSAGFSKGKKKKVFNLWCAAAEQGVAEAQRNLGCAYYEGYGVQENYEEAIRWWEKAADGHDKYAQVFLIEYNL